MRDIVQAILLLILTWAKSIGQGLSENPILIIIIIGVIIVSAAVALLRRH